MPRIPQKPSKAERETPFATVIRDWMWSQRPPMSTGTLAQKLTNMGKSTTRQSVQNWTYRGVVPTLQDTLEILALLGIPLNRLLDAYRASGIRTPPIQAVTNQVTYHAIQPTLPVPTPRAYTLPAQPALNPWDDMLDATIQSMREMGITEEAIQAVANHIRAKASSSEP